LFVADIDNEKITEDKKHKVAAYLNLIGFEMIPSLTNTLMFVNPVLINEGNEINSIRLSNIQTLF